jgi:hypothetical protein
MFGQVSAFSQLVFSLSLGMEFVTITDLYARMAGAQFIKVVAART